MGVGSDCVGDNRVVSYDCGLCESEEEEQTFGEGAAVYGESGCGDAGVAGSVMKAGGWSFVGWVSWGWLWVVR